MAEQQNGYTLYPSVGDSSEGTPKLQHGNSAEHSDNVDSGKLRNFIARALSESLRMSREAELCREKKDRLRAMFSKERTLQLRKDNSTESQNSPSGDRITSNTQQNPRTARQNYFQHSDSQNSPTELLPTLRFPEQPDRITSNTQNPRTARQNYFQHSESQNSPTELLPTLRIPE